EARLVRRIVLAVDTSLDLVAAGRLDAVDDADLAGDAVLGVALDEARAADVVIARRRLHRAVRDQLVLVAAAAVGACRDRLRALAEAGAPMREVAVDQDLLRLRLERRIERVALDVVAVPTEDGLDLGLVVVELRRPLTRQVGRQLGVD